MKNISILFLLVIMTTLSYSDDMKLWYDQPATQWVESLPLGNGRLGAMVYGGTDIEFVKLNEDTLCSDEPGRRTVDIDISKNKEEVFRLLQEGKYAEAQAIMDDSWIGRAQPSYQMMGELRLEFPNKAQVTDYRRWLDISNAVTGVEYKQDDTIYRREVFASYPDDVIVMKLSASKPGSITFNASLGSIHPTAKFSSDNNMLVMDGKVPGIVVRRSFKQIVEAGDQWKYPELFDTDGKQREDVDIVMYGDKIENLGATFQSRLGVNHTGGCVTFNDSGCHVKDADDVVLIISADTSYNGFDKSPSKDGIDPSIKAKADNAKASSKTYTELINAHTEDYKKLFDRMSINLGVSSHQSELPTDKRIAMFKNDKDPALAAILFQYGRYLMIAGSRPGSQPMNLQGIWSNEITPPWAGQFTININTEMNYWPAEVANLSECHEPLFKMIEELAVDGRKVAADMYHNRGWVSHHNTSLWRCAQPVDGSSLYSSWPMSSGWLCSHIWEHYLYTLDKDFLKETAYPLMKEAAVFYVDWMVENSDGYLVTPASTSPENKFYYDDNGTKKTSSVSMGTTMDMSIIRGLFTSCVGASKELGIDKEFRDELEAKLAKLLPYQIGKDGGLQEWSKDFEQYEPHHRHFSHLYGLHPSNQITEQTPDVFEACKKTLQLRGDEATGWSMGWKINAWARLKDGQKSYTILKNLFTLVGDDDENSIGYEEGAGLYANMFDAHPPFQIDGNFGACAGIAEMLIQSHNGYIELLPALPKIWGSGEICGLRARGGFEVDIFWENGKLQKAKIRSISGKDCKVVYDDNIANYSGKAGSEFIFVPQESE